MKGGMHVSVAFLCFCCWASVVVSSTTESVHSDMSTALSNSSSVPSPVDIPNQSEPIPHHHDSGNEASEDQAWDIDGSIEASEDQAWDLSVDNSSTRALSRSKRQFLNGVLFDYRECCCKLYMDYDCLGMCMSRTLADAIFIPPARRCSGQYFCESTYCTRKATTGFLLGRITSADPAKTNKHLCQSDTPPVKPGICPFVDLGTGQYVCRWECSSDVGCDNCVARTLSSVSNTAKCCPAPCGLVCSNPGDPPTACQRHRMQAIGLYGSDMEVVDFKKLIVWIPECEKEANYSYTGLQCLQNTRQCFCVDENGTEIARTRTLTGGILPNCTDRTPRPLSVCEEHAASILSVHGKDLTFGQFSNLSIWLPLCREAQANSTHSYLHRQCLVKTGHCWCISQNGHPIIDTVIPPGGSIVNFQCPTEDMITTCERLAGKTATERVKSLSDAAIRGKVMSRDELELRRIFLPRCLDLSIASPEERRLGGFGVTQCDIIDGALQCWCSSADGIEFIGSSMVVPESIVKDAQYGSGSLDPDDVSTLDQRCTPFKSKNMSRCELQYRLKSRRYKLVKNVLLTKLLTAQEEQEAGILRCKIDSNSSKPFDYMPRQCDTRECWCVDVSGEELPNTRLAKSRPGEINDCELQRTCKHEPCLLNCPRGFKRDSRGCQLCECHDKCSLYPKEFQCQIGCQHRVYNKPTCIECRPCSQNLAPCQDDTGCDFYGLCLSHSNVIRCLFRGGQDATCWYRDPNYTIAYWDSYRPASHPLQHALHTCGQGVCCETRGHIDKGVCMDPCPSMQCKVEVDFTLSDGTSWINRTSCELCLCKAANLTCAQLPSVLAHLCDGKRWEAAFTMGRPRSLLLRHHHSCRSSDVDTEYGDYRRVVYEGGSVREVCTVCKCTAGVFTCTERHCAARRPSPSVPELRVCQACSAAQPHPVCSANKRTYLSRCHATECGLDQRPDMLKRGACVFVEPCRTAVCPPGTKCVARHSPCFGDHCPQYDCVTDDPACSVSTRPEERVCGDDGYTYASLCHLSAMDVMLGYATECLPECYQQVCGGDGITYPSRCHAYHVGVHVDYTGACRVPGDSAVCQLVRNQLDLCHNVSLCRATVTPMGSCCRVCGGAALIAIDVQLLYHLSRAFGSHLNHTQGLVSTFLAITEDERFRAYASTLPVHNIQRPRVQAQNASVNVTECHLFVEMASNNEVSLVIAATNSSAVDSEVCRSLLGIFSTIVNSGKDLVSDSASDYYVLSKSLLAATPLADYSTGSRLSVMSLMMLLLCCAAQWYGVVNILV
eukprot:scpid19990/ scgid32845/ Reversion-inducing cysteine-rich protein with Kazal motifs